LYLSSLSEGAVESFMKTIVKPLVMKFGGTSVGSSRAIIQTVNIIKEYQQKSEQLVVVVSAMSGVTNLLIGCADDAVNGNAEGYHKKIEQTEAKHFDSIDDLPFSESSCVDVKKSIGVCLDTLQNYCKSIQTMREVTPRGLDAITSLGERMNVRQISALLTEQGIKNQFLDADQLIVTDDTFQNARPQRDATHKKIQEKLLPLLAKDVIPVITGFISATANGITTTLGRGGSDYTASILGDCLDAREVWTWTDVDGVMTADPSIVSDARIINHLTFTEVSEMAYFGAKVLHPKTMRPLMEKDIPLRVKNTFNPSAEGTCIKGTAEEKLGQVTCVTTVPDVSLITVRGKGMLGVPGVAARTFSAVAKENASVLMISQSSSEQSICFVIPRGDEIKVIRSLEKELEFELTRGDIDTVYALSDVVIITAIGAGMRHTPGVSARIFGALGKKNINVIAIAQGSSEYSISMVVSVEEMREAVRQIHTEVIINGNY